MKEVLKNIYDYWNGLKKEINKSENKVFFRERDIFFAHLGENIGFEQNGKGAEFLRPVLILKKFGINSAFVIPLSTKIKEGKFYFEFTSSLGIRTLALLSQAKFLDSRRLKMKKGMISKEDFILLKKKLGKLLEIF